MCITSPSLIKTLLYSRFLDGDDVEYYQSDGRDDGQPSEYSTHDDEVSVEVVVHGRAAVSGRTITWVLCAPKVRRHVCV